MQIYGNSRVQESLKLALSSQVQNLCLVGETHLGKASFLKDEFLSLASDSDLICAEPGIESAREVVEFCRTAPLSSPNRYVLVDDAHLLTEAAQDAYLKLLEEPQEKVCIAFVVPDDGYLQPALRSRFRIFFRWKTLSLTEMRSFVLSLSPDDDSRLISLCSGRPGLFKSMYEDGGGSKYMALFDLLMKAVDSKADLLLEPVPEIVKEAKEPLQRECVSQICRMVAETSARFNKDPPSVVAYLYRFSALLLTLQPANAELHWFRAISHISVM